MKLSVSTRTLACCLALSASTLFLYGCKGGCRGSVNDSSNTTYNVDITVNIGNTTTTTTTSTQTNTSTVTTTSSSKGSVKKADAGSSGGTCPTADGGAGSFFSSVLGALAGDNQQGPSRFYTAIEVPVDAFDTSAETLDQVTGGQWIVAGVPMSWTLSLPAMQSVTSVVAPRNGFKWVGFESPPLPPVPDTGIAIDVVHKMEFSTRRQLPQDVRTWISISGLKGVFTSFSIEATRVCPNVLQRVPTNVIDAAMQNPGGVAGWNQLERPGAPDSIYNRRRLWLALRSSSQPYHPMFNSLVFKSGCP